MTANQLAVNSRVLGIRDRYRQSGDTRREAKWSRISDERLDRLLEVRGR